MRYRLMATYRGAPYEAGIGPADGAVVLFAACPPPEELGFEPATGHWRKELRLEDVQAVWQSRPVGTFRGDSCIVLDDLGDRLHIGYLGHDAYRAEQLGYWQVDRGVFELVAARDEVTDIIEERTDYQPGPGPQSGAQPSYPPLPPMTEPSYGPPAGQLRPDYPPTRGLPEPGRMASADGGVTMPPPAAEPPLPLEAEAMRAASAASRRDQPAPPTAAPPATAVSAPAAAPGPPAAIPGSPGSPGSAALYAAAPVPAATDVATGAPLRLLAPLSPAAPPPVAPFVAPPVAPFVAPPSAAGAQPGPGTGPGLGADAATAAGADSPRRRRSAGRRMATERIFGELASLAAIPATSYSVGEEVEGAMCLLETAGGFEVFSSAGGARHEVRVFSDEESACFYLFGVLAADAVRTGVLVPGALPGASRTPASASAPGSAPQR
jgi:hypothetical protein